MLKNDWIDQYTASTYRVTTDGYHGGETFALVKTYGKVLQEYARHPESKCGDDAGNACSEDTLGLLQRRHVHIGRIRRIGKESNKLEAVLLGEISPRDVTTEYPHPVDDEWHTEILPAVKIPPPAYLPCSQPASARNSTANSAVCSEYDPSTHAWHRKCIN